tara:strand:- start:4662 stop:4832 length:171 start_codon:yes stop_codon:yes gene_type:complete
MQVYNEQTESYVYTPEAMQAMRSEGKPGKLKRITGKAQRKAHSDFRKARQQRHNMW